LSGECPQLSFRLDGRTVNTTSATRFKDVSCSSLRNLMRVEVKGMLMSNGTVVADEVKRED
jgi:Domain of unknown function (DUF5666)